MAPKPDQNGVIDTVLPALPVPLAPLPPLNFKVLIALIALLTNDGFNFSFSN